MSKITIIEGNSNDKNNVRVIMVKGEQGYSAYDLYVKNGGTLTEEQWLDAFLNAENFYNKNEVDTSQENQNAVINKKPYYFNKIADMKSYNLQVGDMAITKGYYNANDGGGAEYYITNTESEEDYQEILNNNLYANLIVSDLLNVKQIGAKGNNIDDDTQKIITALSISNNIIIPFGTYKITDEIIVGESKSIIGEKEKTIIQFYGNSNCFVVDGRFISIKNLKIIADASIVSNNKCGIVVNSNIVSQPSRTTYTNIIIESCVLQGFNKGISLDIMWQVTIRNCIIIGEGKGSENNRNNYGISYENSGTIISNWSGSGNIIESCYISNFSYALHILGGWNVTLIDNIIEGNYCSIYNYNSNRTLVINNWFEANQIQPILESELIMIGGRKNVLTDNTTLEFPNDLNNLHLIYSGGDTINKYNQKLMSNIANEEAILSGIKNQVPSSGSTKITSLKAFTSRGNVITNEGIVSDNNLTGELSIVGKGTDGGISGKSYTQLEFKSGQTDGNNVDVALRTVFLVDKDGNITNPNANDSVDIGSANHKYKFGWFRNIIIFGDDGNYYKLGVDSSGNPKATRI